MFILQRDCIQMANFADIHMVPGESQVEVGMSPINMLIL